MALVIRLRNQGLDTVILSNFVLPLLESPHIQFTIAGDIHRSTRRSRWRRCTCKRSCGSLPPASSIPLSFPRQNRIGIIRQHFSGLEAHGRDLRLADQGVYNFCGPEAHRHWLRFRVSALVIPWYLGTLYYRNPRVPCYLAPQSAFRPTSLSYSFATF